MNPVKPQSKAMAMPVVLVLMADAHAKGVFAMGGALMPCANEQALHKALQNE